MIYLLKKTKKHTLPLKLKHKTFWKEQSHVGVFFPGVSVHSSLCVWLLCELIRSEGITVIGRLVNH